MAGYRTGKVGIRDGIQNNQHDYIVQNPQDEVKTPEEPCGGYVGKKVQLFSDTGHPLTRCHNCGPGDFSISILVFTPDATQGSYHSDWTIKQIGDKCALEAMDMGKIYYLQRCPYCWNDQYVRSDLHNYALFLTSSNATVDTVKSLFTIDKLENDMITIKADNGNYVGRCNGCVQKLKVSTNDSAFAHVSTVESFNTWRVKVVNTPPAPQVEAEPEPEPEPEILCSGFANKKVKIIADTGKLLSRCNGCGPGKYSNSISMHLSKDDPNPYSKWTIVPSNGKCALKSDLGSYAFRCVNCWTTGSVYSDSLFLPSTSSDTPPTGPESLFTIEKQSSGKFIFKADTGKLIGRCNGCFSGSKLSPPDFAFVHTSSPASYNVWSIEVVQ
ncbi:hypothetical protein GINT2_001254 [Glugoides intestinalis]